MNTEILTHQATSSYSFANRLAQKKNHKTIHGDDLFRGIYQFMKKSDYKDIFFSLIGCTNTNKWDQIFQEEYDNFGIKIISDDVLLSPQIKIKKQISQFVNDNDAKIDVMVLFTIALSNLSTGTHKRLKASKINIETIDKNCEKVLQNPIVSEQGLFAFLEILNKLFSKLNLPLKNVKIMDINNINDFNHINMLLDEVDRDVMDKGESTIEETPTKSGKKEEKKMTIEYFGTDLTKEVEDGMIDPIIGREQEINQMIYTLLRKNKNNPLLIGEAGVGKTAVVEGLAQRIQLNQVPEKLKNKRLFLLDMGTLVAGTKYRGEFEARMKSILEEAMDPTNNIILFIDEIHTIIGAGGQENNDAAQMIKPLLSRGKIKLIGATTFNEYQKHIEKDAALKRRFQEIVVNEPDNEATKQIIEGLKITYEDFHGVQIDEESIDAAIMLSKRYMLNKHLPDKALDLIDEACAKKSTMSAKLEKDEDYKAFEDKINDIQKKIEDAIERQDYFSAAELKEQEEDVKKQMLVVRNQKNIPTHLRPMITKQDIGTVLAEKLGIPSNIVNESEIEKLKRLSVTLKGHIVGQDEAVDAIVKTLTRSRLSVINKSKPMGSFLFLGPSGVGKTYLAKLIAKEYFGDEEAMIRFDMSEFMEKYSVSKLIGSPAGYVGYEEGGSLTEAIRRKPYSVLLFDEIEKASPDVLNIMLQILDEGKLKDSKGRWIDCKSTIIVMTSNIGSEEFGKKQVRIGFSSDDGTTSLADKDFNELQSRVLEELKNHMTPELINRLDYKIVFKHLNKDTLAQIMKIKVDEFLGTRKNNTDIKLPVFSDKNIKEIIDKIYDPQYGARPLERYIQDTIEPEIINKILEK